MIIHDSLPDVFIEFYHSQRLIQLLFIGGVENADSPNISSLHFRELMLCIPYKIDHLSVSCLPAIPFDVDHWFMISGVRS